jgi:molybdopterin molybdotransferase
MLPVKQAEEIILGLVQPMDPVQDREQVELLSARGRVLAESVVGSLDFPHWDNSAMDGYAVRYEDVAEVRGDRPIQLEIIEEIPAGKPPQKTIDKGQAARIFTGSMMPPGADTVTIQEDTQRQGDRVEILSAPSQRGEWVRYQGSFYQSGTPLLSPGIVLSAPDIAVLATAQITQVPVYRRCKIAILSTGDELVAPGQPLKPGQLVDSNQYALGAAVSAAGGEPLLMGIVGDQPEELQKAIAKALTTADIVLSTGGVSVGDYDYVEQILTQLKGTIHIKKVGIRPGKPLTVASFPREASTSSVLYFGLPGNPVSALVTFWRFVQPAMRKFAGWKQGWEPQFLTARSQQELRGGGPREIYLWGKIHCIDGIYQFELAGGSHSSGNLINLAQTTALAVIPVGVSTIAPGDAIQVLAIDR